jgi:hypothetical protein
MKDNFFKKKKKKEKEEEEIVQTAAENLNPTKHICVMLGTVAIF